MDERQQPLRAIRATFDGTPAPCEVQRGRLVVWIRDPGAIFGHAPAGRPVGQDRPLSGSSCGVFADIAAISRFQNSRLGLGAPVHPGDIVCSLRCCSWCARTLGLDARCADFRGSPRRFTGDQGQRRIPCLEGAEAFSCTGYRQAATGFVDVCRFSSAGRARHS